MSDRTRNKKASNVSITRSLKCATLNADGVRMEQTNPCAGFTPDQLRRLIHDIIACRTLPLDEDVTPQELTAADSQVIVGTMEMRFVSGADDRPLLYAQLFRPAN